MIGAISSDPAGNQPSLLSLQNPSLILQSQPNSGLMLGSGTSFATPVVSGVVALLLQANPGLTPPLVKAILQYTAEPLGTAEHLRAAGRRPRRRPGRRGGRAVALTNIASQVASGTNTLGDSLLAPGMQQPAPLSNNGGQAVNWSRCSW